MKCFYVQAGSVENCLDCNYKCAGRLPLGCPINEEKRMDKMPAKSMYKGKEIIWNDALKRWEYADGGIVALSYRFTCHSMSEQLRDEAAPKEDGEQIIFTANLRSCDGVPRYIGIQVDSRDALQVGREYIIEITPSLKLPEDAVDGAEAEAEAEATDNAADPA